MSLRSILGAATAEPAMLGLCGVSAGYGSFQALFEVSLSVAAGEAVGVIGPNGAGKTTLMRVISGLLPIAAGEVSLEGRPLTRVAHQVVEAGIAHVPENRRLFPRLSVEENLRMGAFVVSARLHFTERLAWVYELFPRLRERRRQLAGTLSGDENEWAGSSAGSRISDLQPHIGLPDRRVLAQFGGGAGEADMASLEEIGAVDEI